jgi:hypothetical protein
MFIIGIRTPIGYMAGATPALLAIAGIIIAFRALKR